MDQQNQFNPVNNTVTSNDKMPINGFDNTPTSPDNHKKVGPIITALVVVLLLIIGALYILASKVNQQPVPENITSTDETSTTSTQEVTPISGTTDDIGSLQSDLNASITGVDAQSI